MATTQYIGARYVPVFADPIDWDNTKAYEPLTIVLHDGNSYTTKQYTPKGIDISDTRYWALTGNYNAQIEQYRSEVATLDGRITTNETNLRDILPFDETPTEGSAKGVTSDGIKKAIDTAEQANADAIAIEVTRAKEAEQANADAIAIEVTRAKEAEQANADAIADTIKNLVFTNPLYGVCRIANTSTWKYVCTYDFSSIGTMGNLPSRNNSFDYSDASNLFEHNGILYYPQDAHQDIYATRDGETWESGYGINYPKELAIAYRQWAPMLFEDEVGNVKLAMARQYNSGTITNSNDSTTWNFRIDVFDCTVDSDGKITISDHYVTVLSAGTHIDPYIVYTEAYGYIMACKDENTCQIELYSGNSLTNMVKKATLPYICCEAPKFIVKDNLMALYMQAYSFRPGDPTNHGDIIGNFYLSTAVNLDDFSFAYMDVITCPNNYRHIAFAMNSEVLSKYARRHGILPYGVNNASDRLHIVQVTGADVCINATPIKFVLYIVGGNRTITIHKPQFKTNTAGIIYVVGATPNTPTLTDGSHSHVVKNGEVFPIFVSSEGTTFF